LESASAGQDNQQRAEEVTHGRQDAQGHRGKARRHEAKAAKHAPPASGIFLGFGWVFDGGLLSAFRSGVFGLVLVA
jgi:hypothetical protein